jgi:hypothetical protein
MLATFAAGCGPFSELPWILDEARMLAVRIDVVEEGPYSVGLVPIPVDRVRQEPLPLDTVSVTPFVADVTGLRAAEEFDFRWFRCDPFESACLSLLREPGAGQPCTDILDTNVICSLADGPTARWRLPDFDLDKPLGDQIGHRVVAVGGQPGLSTTAECITELQRDIYTDLEGCLLTYVPLTIGPLGALATAAEAVGVEVPQELGPGSEARTAGLQPNFHPEIVALQLQDSVTGERFSVRPGERVSLPAHAQIELLSVGDPRDRQTRVIAYPTGDDILAAFGIESRFVSSYVTPPGDLSSEFFPSALDAILTGEPGDAFQLFVVLSDGVGSQTLGVFDIEVVAE